MIQQKLIYITSKYIHVHTINNNYTYKVGILTPLLTYYIYTFIHIYYIVHIYNYVFVRLISRFGFSPLIESRVNKYLIIASLHASA